LTTIDMKNYEKPELILIDDSAFDETGQGCSYPNCGHNGGNNHNHGGNNNHGGKPRR
jgi:hypothetical protein